MKIIGKIYNAIVLVAFAAPLLLLIYYLLIAYRLGYFPDLNGQCSYYYGLTVFRMWVINVLVFSYWAVLFSIGLFVVLSFFYKLPFMRKKGPLLIIVTGIYTLLLFSNFPVWLLGD